MIFLLSFAAIAKPMELVSATDFDEKATPDKKISVRFEPETKEERERRYARINSFLDSYLAGAFKDRNLIVKYGRGVVFKHYGENGWYAMKFVEANNILYKMHKKIQHIHKKTKIMNDYSAQKMFAIEDDIKQNKPVSERRRNFLLLERFAEFVALSEKGDLPHRLIYLAAWATCNPEKIQKTSKYKLYYDDDLYIPLAQRLLDIKAGNDNVIQAMHADVARVQEIETHDANNQHKSKGKKFHGY